MHKSIKIISLLVIGLNTAQAQDSASVPPSSPAAQSTAEQIASIEQRLSELKTKRNWGYAGMAAGTVALVASMVKGTIDDQKKADEEAEQNGTIREAQIKYDGALLGVGLVALGLGWYTLDSAGHESNALNAKKISLITDPATGAYKIQVAFIF